MRNLIAALLLTAAPAQARSLTERPPTVDPGRVAGEIATHMNGIRQCEQLEGRGNVPINGKLVLHLIVAPDGQVSDVEVDVDTVHDYDLARCVLKRALSWKLITAVGGAEISYSLLFQGGGR